MVRAVDVLSGVLSGAAPEPARRVVASRVLRAVEERLFPLHEEPVGAQTPAGGLSGGPGPFHVLTPEFEQPMRQRVAGPARPRSPASAAASSQDRPGLRA
ncbi:hypothetical protein ACWCQP_49835 [Streptomyces chartreusis]